MKEEKNPYKAGDKVELLVDVYDDYAEIWHDIGDIMEVKYIAKDGKGLMFWSKLGTHFKNVKKANNQPLTK